MLKIRKIVVGAMLLVAGSANLVGCGGGTPTGPRTYPVVGTVSYTGEPLKEAELLIRSADGKHATGTRVTDGKFQMRVPAGASIIEITAMRDIPGEFREENPGERVAVREQFIPAKYNTESTLRLEVTPTTKDVKFELLP